MTLSIVLPCYNEEKNISNTVRDVASWIAGRGITCEIIVVDDGSRDRTQDTLESLKAELPALRVIRHEKNSGYGVAVRTGCDAAKTEWIAFMDSDGQFKAADLSILLEHTGKYAFITGRRLKRADPLIRRLFGKLLAVMNGLVLGIWIRDVNCGMKMFRREIWEDIRPRHGVEKLFNTEMFLRLKQAGIPWIQVKVPHYPRVAGTPTGGSIRVILRMFRELFDLKSSIEADRQGRLMTASTDA